MFVLCPHCHFLVGIDPRTGKPPAACPKCGGVVVEPLPDMPAEGTHAEEVPAPLAPFAPVELPSVLPTLPDVEVTAEQDEQTQDTAPAAAVIAEAETAPAPAPSAVIETAATPEPKQRWWSRRKAEPAVAPASTAHAAATETATPPAPVASSTSPSEAEAAPTPAPSAAIETAATPEPKPRWWSRRKTEPVVAPASTTPAAATETATPPAPVATPASPAAPVDPARAEAMIAALRGRRKTTRKAAEPPPLPVQPPPIGAVMEVEVEIDALPPAVQIEDVVATPNSGIESQAETPAAPTAKRARRTLAAAARDVDPPAPTTASIESVAAADIPVVVMDSTPLGGLSGDLPTPAHPLRRRTDFDPNATSEPVAGSVPPHPLRRRTDAPSFTRPRARTNAAARIGWRSLVAAGGLSVLLVLQLLLAQRDTLAASARWRPTIAAVCATLRCSLPPWHEPAAFTMLSRDVRPHPGAPGTLLINASFRNDARWPQPWPRLLLTLSDLDGRMVGARSFADEEYLGAAPTQSELAPGQTAAVTLSVVEPAPNIVAFTFDFR